MFQLAQPSFLKLSDAIVDPVKGRGYGKFIEGEPITTPSQVKVGDLLCEYCIQFHACNLIRVVKTDWPEEPETLKSKKFYGVIMDPKDPSVPGIGSTGEICFWDLEFSPTCIEGSERKAAGKLSPTFHAVLHRAILSDQPQRRLRLQAGDRKTAVEATNTPEGRKMLEWFAERNGAGFMLSGTSPAAQIIEIKQSKPGLVPLMVEHRIG